MIKKITILCFAIFVNIISAQTVNIEGNPYGGNPYATISEAIVACNNGDVILISGVHTEAITIDKSITLRGMDPTTDIIQAAENPSSDGTGTRVISLTRLETNVLTITIENLGIRHGNADLNSNGGGIDSDKITGLLTLRNLIIENNHSSRNGGALSFAGSNVEMIDCTVRNNSASLDGGAILVAPNNASGIDNVINIKQSLINNNNGRNGGGIYINGNNNFGNNFKVSVNIENTTVSNNASISPSSGNGGGAVFVASAVWTGGGAISNVTLNLIHATIYNNTHAAANKAGLQFAGAGLTNFSAYNSIIVSTDDLLIKALNFSNTNTIDVVNCILGGLNAPPTLVDDESKNNLKGKTATFAGLTGTLSNEGGFTQVFTLTEGSTAIDFCSAATNVTMPTTDQRGYLRNGIADAGAFEVAGTLSNNDFSIEKQVVKLYPNPTRENFQISGLENITAVKIYSTHGFLEKSFSNLTHFSVADLPSGMHLIVIESDHQNYVERLMIE